MKKIAFIGVGNMGSAILKSVCKAYPPSHISIYCPTVSKREALAESLGCLSCSSAAEAVKDAYYIIIGVKPDKVAGVLSEISDYICEDAKIVSMAAGITIETMHNALCKNNNIIRMIPNTPSEIGMGLVLLAPCRFTAEETVNELKEIFSPCGLVDITDEKHADICMTVGGCTPAYVYMFIEALADGAVACGLSRKEALEYAAKAVEGAAAMVLASGRHPAELKDAVCSPGGSTIRGLQKLEEKAFRGTVIDCMVEAYNKNASLGK